LKDIDVENVPSSTTVPIKRIDEKFYSYTAACL
jgi:hypothetical protein